MKKGIAVILSVLFAIGLFVSCSNEMNTPDQGTAYVRFADESTSRALTNAFNAPSAGEFYWFYTAKKTDGGLNGGACSTEKAVSSEKGLSGTVGPFSVGTWTFTLTAYMEQSKETLIYRGSTNTVLSANETKTVNVPVSHVGGIGAGFFNISGITFSSSAATSVTGITLKIHDSNGNALDDKEYTLTPDQESYSLGSTELAGGIYQFRFYDQSNNQIANQWVLILAGRTVTIFGEITEDTGNTAFEVDFAESAFTQYNAYFYVNSDYEDPVDAYNETVEAAKNALTTYGTTYVIRENTVTVLSNSGEGVDGLNSAISNALQNASNSVAYVVLQDNIDTDSTITIGNEGTASNSRSLLIPKNGTVILDLNGNSIKYTGTDAAIILNDSDLTLTITNKGNEAAINSTAVGVKVQQGNLSIEDGSISATDAAIFIADGNVELKVSGGKIATTGGGNAIVLDSSVDSLVNAPVISGSTIEGAIDEKISSSVITFQSGDGSYDSPYIITSEAQFANIHKLGEEMAAGAYYYFSVTESLDFSSATAPNPFIPVFRGEIDFNGNNLLGITLEKLKNMTDLQSEYIRKYPGDSKPDSLIQLFMSGKISNLNMTVSDALVFSYYLNWTNGAYPQVRDGKPIEFNKVTITSGDALISLDAGLTNFSPFMSQAFNTTVSFSDCISDVNVQGGKYGSAFVGGYGINVDFYFNKCVNRGNITSERAGMLVGNASNSANSKFYINNCTNEGNLSGTISADLICAWGDGYSAWKPAVLEGSVTSADGLVTILNSSFEGISSTVDENKYITVSSSNAEVAQFMIVASGYARFENNSGTRLLTVETTKINISNNKSVKTEMAMLDMIDSRAFTEAVSTNDGGYGNKTVEKDGVKYYYFEDTSVPPALQIIVGPDSGYTMKLSYTILVYDAEDNLIGSSTVTGK